MRFLLPPHARLFFYPGCLRSGRNWALLAAGLAALACAAPAQQPGTAMGPLGMPDPLESGPIMAGPLTPATVSPLAQERLCALNVERQKLLLADTDRLVNLARRLNAEINAAHPSELSPEQLRQAEEIEKLARSVKQEMSATMLEPSNLPAPGIAMPGLQPAPF